MTGDEESRRTGVLWEELTAQRRDGAGDVARPRLAAPRGLSARPGRGQVTLDWQPVDGAAGYLVRRADRRDGEYVPLEIGEPWVRPVPHPPLTDTTGTAGRPAWYTVAAVAAVDDHEQPSSDPVEATSMLDGGGMCRVEISADRRRRPLHDPGGR